MHYGMNRDQSQITIRASNQDSNRRAGTHGKAVMACLGLFVLVAASACSGASGSGSGCNGGPTCGAVTEIDTPGNGVVVVKGSFPGSDPTGPHQLLMVLT